MSALRVPAAALVSGDAGVDVLKHSSAAPREHLKHVSNAPVGFTLIERRGAREPRVVRLENIGTSCSDRRREAAH